MLPDAVLERLAPHAASGGAIGPDGLLYVMGHDRPEIYVLAKPKMGPALVSSRHLGNRAEGQAFAWDRSAPRRIVAISRPNSVVRAFDVPSVRSITLTPRASCARADAVRNGMMRQS